MSNRKTSKKGRKLFPLILPRIFPIPGKDPYNEVWILQPYPGEKIMMRKEYWIGLFLVFTSLTGAATVDAECDTERANLNAPDLEYMGLNASGQRLWVGQQFSTDCDGQFLTARFLIDIQLFEENGIPPLSSGDLLTCTVMDDQNRPIASVDKALVNIFGLEWVLFDFEPLQLGLAAGTLAVKVSTAQDAYCRVNTSLDQVPGQLMLGNLNDLNFIPTGDAGFVVTWDPDAIITGVESQSWGGVKALYR